MPTETKNTLEKLDSIKSAIDGYRPFPDHVVKQAKGDCNNGWGGVDRNYIGNKTAD